HVSRKGGAVHREDGSVPTSAVARRGPASSLDLECGPPLGAPGPGRFERAFRRSASHSPVGARRCNLFRTLRHLLTRWGLLVQLPHFRLAPALSALRLPPRSYLRSPATRHRLSQAPHSRSASSSLLKKRSLREQERRICFAYGCVNLFVARLRRAGLVWPPGTCFDSPCKPAVRNGTRYCMAASVS